MRHDADLLCTTSALCILLISRQRRCRSSLAYRGWRLEQRVACENLEPGRFAVPSGCKCDTVTCGASEGHAVSPHEWRCKSKDQAAAPLLLSVLTCALYLQLIFSRQTLITAVNERWSSDQKEGKFKRTVVCSWLKQALAQVRACTSSCQSEQ